MRACVCGPVWVCLSGRPHSLRPKSILADWTSAGQSQRPHGSPNQGVWVGGCMRAFARVCGHGCVCVRWCTYLCGHAGVRPCAWRCVHSLRVSVSTLMMGFGTGLRTLVRMSRVSPATLCSFRMRTHPEHTRTHKRTPTHLTLTHILTCTPARTHTHTTTEKEERQAPYVQGTRAAAQPIQHLARLSLGRCRCVGLSVCV